MICSGISKKNSMIFIEGMCMVAIAYAMIIICGSTFYSLLVIYSV